MIDTLDPTEAKSHLSSRLFFLGCLLVCLGADYALARQLPPNSDSVQAYNEMLAIRDGNHLLHHWVLATDNFSLTDLPPMLLASWIFGPGPRLTYIVPFAVFGALLAASILLVRSALPTSAGRLAGAYAVLLLIGVPYDVLYGIFFWSDFHIATIAGCLFAIVLIEPCLASQRLARWRLLPFTALVFAVTFSDPMAEVVLVGPIWLFASLRAWLSGLFRLDDWLAAACAAAGACAGIITLHALAATGISFRSGASVTLQFVPGARALLRDLHALLGGEQVLFGARAVLIRALPFHVLLATARLLTALAVAVMGLAVVWGMPRTPRAGAAQLLLLGAACLGSMAAMSDSFRLAVGTGPDFPGAALRFVAPQFLYLCLAAALQFGALVGRRPLAGRRWLIGTGCALAAVHASGGMVAAVRAASAPAGIETSPDAKLACWLKARGFRHGVGDYWDTQVVDALTGGAVLADPIFNVGGRLLPYPWLTDASRYGTRPQFAIIRPDGVFHVDLPSVAATYGPPLAITEIGDRLSVVSLGPNPPVNLPTSTRPTDNPHAAPPPAPPLDAARRRVAR